MFILSSWIIAYGFVIFTILKLIIHFNAHRLSHEAITNSVWGKCRKYFAQCYSCISNFSFQVNWTLLWTFCYVYSWLFSSEQDWKSAGEIPFQFSRHTVTCTEWQLRPPWWSYQQLRAGSSPSVPLCAGREDTDEGGSPFFLSMKKH